MWAAWLSNFAPCTIVVRGVDYPSVEHAYQACKTEDPKTRLFIRDMATPALAKSFGRRLPLRPDWDVIKWDVMYWLTWQRWKRPTAALNLVLTFDIPLVEVNTWGDRYWGECPAGVGCNHLGKILMLHRDALAPTTQED